MERRIKGNPSAHCLPLTCDNGREMTQFTGILYCLENKINLEVKTMKKFKCKLCKEVFEANETPVKHS